ncbi:T9SS type A sorting domain-containing protein [Parasediminibacterium sp. JCM 36343]|uniref:T9SS type A sorting domain-containing protein n=1 Tax=Parasediminibacterium sp. JCM 36343 TaxID=3374279 RepID=UPI0039785B48
MKKIFLLLLLSASLAAHAGTVIWQGAADANWTATSSWLGGVVPTSADSVVFRTAGASVTLDFTTGLVIGKLTIAENVTFKTALARTLNVGSNTFTAGSTVFTVAAGKSLTLQSTINSVGITLTVVTGYKGSISGTVNLSAGASTGQTHKLTSPDVGGITFNSGSFCNTTSVSSSNPFGASGTDGSVVFASGSVFVFFGGSTPFGTNAICTFNTGSKFSFQYNTGSTGPTGLNKTYADFEYNTTASVPFQSAGGVCNIDNLTILNGTLTINGLSSGSSVSTFNIKKNITISSPGTLAVGSASGTNTGGVVFNFAGTAQSFTNTGTFTVNSFGNSGYTTTINVNGGSTLTLNNDFDATTGGTGTAANRAFKVLATGTLVIPSGKGLKLPGAFTNNGTISGAGTVTLNGSAAQAITGTGTLANLTLNNSSGATISSGMQSLTGVLSVSAGTLSTGGFLTLKSTSIANSAVVDQVGGAISGDVIVERFIPKGYRSYRDIAPGVYSTTGTIKSNWQEGATTGNTNPKTGYGIFITGGTPTAGTTSTPNSVDVTTGFDVSKNAAKTAYTFTGGSWGAIANTLGILNPYKGYRLLIRGDRSFSLYGQAIDNTPLGLLMYNATTLRATGKIIYGDVKYTTSGVTNNTGTTFSSFGDGTISLNPNPGTAGSTTINGVTTTTYSDGYSFVANPYICPVSWTTLQASSSNISTYYYYLDPTIGATGSYVAYDNSSVHYIQPGQAIFVVTTATSPVVKFTESAKAASSTKTAVFGTSTTTALPISLWRKEAVGSYKKMGIATVEFSDAFSNSFGSEDAPFIGGSTTDILTLKEGTAVLLIDARKPATKSDVISLFLQKLATDSYQLQLDGSAYEAPSGLLAYLYDSYTKTNTPLAKGINTIAFAADSSIAASYQDRFTIVFKPTILSVSSITASAILKDGAATISWNTVGENKVASYTVEKSTDGTTYTSIGTVAAKNTATASYSYIDNAPAATSYYRIKATSADGSINYSNIATLTTYNVQRTTLYPNPLVGKTLNVKLEGVSAGKYSVSIYNSLGQKVHNETINHNAGSVAHALSISKLANGVYNVTIGSSNDKKVVYQASVTVQ